MECKIRDINVHYKEAGTGRPFFFVHGWAVNGRTAMHDIEPLFKNRPGWRRIYPDLLGHGSTPWPVWAQGHDDVLNVLLEFMDTIAPGERFVIGGISWGGYIARAVVHHRLKQVDGVILSVPLLHWMSDGLDLPAKQILHDDPAFVAALQPDEGWLKNMIVAQSQALVEKVRSDFLAYAMPQDTTAGKLLPDTSFSFDLDSLPEPCPAPALFIMGRQDHVVGYKPMWPILNNFPRGTYAVLDRAGHFLSFEQPVLLRMLTSDWLDRVEEFAP